MKTKTKHKKYESHYLAIVLVGFLLLEGILVSSTSSRDWQTAVQVLDVSVAVTQTQATVTAIIQPVAEAIAGLNEFYKLASIEMMNLLDLSQNNPIEDVAYITAGVYQFYQDASTQLASLLDISSVGSGFGQGSVAGASVY